MLGFDRPDPAIRSEWLLEPSLRGFNLQEAEATLRQILWAGAQGDERVVGTEALSLLSLPPVGDPPPHVREREAARAIGMLVEAQLAFDALSIEGGLLAAEWLAKVAQLEASGQSGDDYRVPKGLQLRDEMGRSWRIAQAWWREWRTATGDWRTERNKEEGDLPFAVPHSLFGDPDTRDG